MLREGLVWRGSGGRNQGASGVGIGNSWGRMMGYFNSESSWGHMKGYSGKSVQVLVSILSLKFKFEF